MIAKTAKISICVLGAIFALSVLFPLVPTLANTNTDSAAVRSETVNLIGTIRKLAVEGTCYQLAADNGQKYELMGKFPKIDGARVQVSGVIATDVMTICQVGQPFKVKSVRVIR
jgi:hypothetical protein